LTLRRADRALIWQQARRESGKGKIVMPSENGRHMTIGAEGVLARVPATRQPAGLFGRGAPCRELDRLVSAVRAGQSRALVVRGEPGIGKTALFEYLAAHAVGCRVESAAGIQPELDLPFAGLHQLC
jgi:hypothetical protein